MALTGGRTVMHHPQIQSYKGNEDNLIRDDCYTAIMLLMGGHKLGVNELCLYLIALEGDTTSNAESLTR